MKNYIAALGLILSLGFAHKTTAQEGKLWNLKECVDYAYQHNISIRTQQNTVLTNKNNQFQSKMNLLPGASASASQSYSGGGRSIDPFTNTIVVGQTFRSNNFSLGANWTLFRGFQNINALSQSTLTTKASELDVETQKNNISLNIVSAYVNMLAGYEQVTVAEEQLKLTQAQVSRTQKLVTAGASAEVNLLNLNAQLATDELGLITAQNALDLARLQIQQLMQKPVEQAFDIERPKLEVPTSASLLESPQQIYQTAEKSLPQIKSAETRIVSANKQIQITKGGFSPTLDMTFGYFTNYSGLATGYTLTGFEERQSQYFYRDANSEIVPVYQLSAVGKTDKIGFSSQFKDNIRQSLSFSLNVPIFSNWQNHTNLSNAKIQCYNAELNAQTAKNTLRQEVEQAWLDARTASKRYESTQKQVQSLSEAMRANEQRLNVGAINSVDYTQSKTNLAKAASDLVRAKYDLVLRIKLLDFYLGKGLDLN
jgi:outer membrane protein